METAEIPKIVRILLAAGAVVLGLAAGIVVVGGLIYIMGRV